MGCWVCRETDARPSCTHMTMTKRDDESLAEQNAEIRRWAEANGLTLGSRLGQQEDMVERLTPRGSVIEFTVRIDEDVYEAAMYVQPTTDTTMRPRSSKRRCESGREGTRLPRIT